MTPAYEREAQAQADEVRERLGLGDGGIPDVFHVLEDLALHVARRPVGASVDGAYVALPGSQEGVALINTDTTLGQQRFTGAHELAHHLFDRERETLVDEDVWALHRPTFERRANSFAAHLLMPPRGVRTWVERVARGPLEPGFVVEMMYHFGVSFAAALRQLEALQYLSPRTSQRIDDALRGRLRQMALRLGYPPHLVSPTRDIVLPRDYVRRAFDAYAQGLIGDSRLAELLFTSEPDARSQAEAAGAVSPLEEPGPEAVLADA
ncbi:MAG: ImmA/IrrE family metallo-endopeptidase [Chloroflexi bacterium]|nr:ImmA/IrrE family metallo-endopeptidase [Chloroflexota bacterium]